MARELTVEHRLHERAQHEAVVGCHEVQRRPHHHDAHDLAVEQQLRQLVGSEPIESRPQPNVGIQRYLGLHADQVLDGVEHAHARPAEQQLTLEGRAVEHAAAQGVSAHMVILARKILGGEARALTAG